MRDSNDFATRFEWFCNVIRMVLQPDSNDFAMPYSNGFATRFECFLQSDSNGLATRFECKFVKHFVGGK